MSVIFYHSYALQSVNLFYIFFYQLSQYNIENDEKNKK